MNSKFDTNQMDTRASSSHLSAEQMEAMLRPSPYKKQAGKHLESCSSCHDEVEALSGLLMNFRTASTQYAEQQRPDLLIAGGQELKRSSMWKRPLGLALATGALACALVAPVCVHFFSPMSSVHNSPSVRRDNTPTSAISDEALLEGVQNDLSTSVPNSLQVLAATTATQSSEIARGNMVNQKSQ